MDSEESAGRRGKRDRTHPQPVGFPSGDAEPAYGRARQSLPLGTLYGRGPSEVPISPKRGPALEEGWEALPEGSRGGAPPPAIIHTDQLGTTELVTDATGTGPRAMTVAYSSAAPFLD